MEEKSISSTTQLKSKEGVVALDSLAETSDPP
jgi:hypothetical protein